MKKNRKKIEIHASLMVALSAIFAFAFVFVYKAIPLKFGCEYIDIFLELLYLVAIAIISSAIFYFVTIYFPAKKRKKTAETIFLPWINKLSKLGNSILIDLTACSDISYKEFISICNTKEFTDYQSYKLMNFIDASNNCHNWFEYFEKVIAKEDYLVRELFIYKEYIPNETQSLLLQLGKDSGLDIYNHFAEVAYSDEYDSPLGNKNNVSCIAKQIWEHIQILKSLEQNQILQSLHI